MYSVSKMTEYSASALERASAELRSALAHEAVAVKNEAEWKIFRDRWMARKNGVLTQINDLWLKDAPKDAKRVAGQQVNQIKEQVEQRVEAAKNWLRTAPLELIRPGIDVSVAAGERYGFEK